MTTKLEVVKRDIDKALLEMAEEILAQVKSGDIKGLVTLINRYGEDYDVGAAGDMRVSEVMHTFEVWKTEQYVMSRFKLQEK
jgi:hypothetical protein